MRIMKSDDKSETPGSAKSGVSRRVDGCQSSSDSIHQVGGNINTEVDLSDAGGALSAARSESDNPGLVYSHIIDREGIVKIWNNGSLLKVTRKVEGKDGKQGRGLKSKITDFNWNTKVRLMQTLGMLDKSILPVYWVATFPDEYFPYRFTGEKSVQIIKIFGQRVVRKFPQAGVIWRREHERRKSGRHVGAFFPHYNFLFWNVSASELNTWLPVAWYEVTGELTRAQLKAYWYAEQVKDWKQMVYYLSKYVAKDNQDYFAEAGWGHWWGFINKRALPWVQPVVISLTDSQAVKLLRYAKRRVKGRRHLNSRYVITGYPDFWLSRLGDMLDVGIESLE